jgi:hypothetical protein
MAANALQNRFQVMGGALTRPSQLERVLGRLGGALGLYAGTLSVSWGLAANYGALLRS